MGWKQQCLEPKNMNQWMYMLGFEKPRSSRALRFCSLAAWVRKQDVLSVTGIGSLHIFLVDVCCRDWNTLPEKLVMGDRICREERHGMMATLVNWRCYYDRRARFCGKSGSIF